MWIFATIFSALFGGIGTVLVKHGVKHTDSDLATALRTVVVFLFSWCVVFIVGSQNLIFEIPADNVIYLSLSGITTGACWLCLLKALSCGDVNKVVPVDKLCTVISIILAILFFNETSYLFVKLICTALLAFGIFLMAEKGNNEPTDNNKKWLLFAILSAFFGAVSSVLSKPGLYGVDSNLANAFRAIIILAMTWIALLAKRKIVLVKKLNKKDLIFITLSGIATGGAWLCYYYAIQNGVVSVVVPVDRLNVLVSIVFARIFLKERLSKKSFIGLIIIIAATVTIAFIS